jgi:hypothetical protein
MRPGSGANMFAKGHEQGVDFHPVSRRQFLLQRRHRFLRRARLDQAPAIGNAVDVDIDADQRQAARDADGEVGTLGADTMKGLQHGRIARKRPAELLHRLAGDGANGLGLGLMERAGGDQAVDGLFG